MATIGSSTLLLLLLLLSGPPDADALELGLCGSPLGMESGVIKDSAISASSAYDSSIVGPQHGRLRTDKNGGAWCPRQMVSKDAKEYLQVDLEELHVITGARTQGRFGNGQGQEYTEEYMMDYWRPGFSKWARWRNREGKTPEAGTPYNPDVAFPSPNTRRRIIYRLSEEICNEFNAKMLPGNTNTYTIIDQKLDPPIIASKVRFLPYSDHVRTVCMRVELLGCKWTDGLLSYSVPQGLHRGEELDLTDRTYDGTEHSGVLSGGLGQLVDGQKGQDNFRLDLSGYGKGYEWIGWRNDTPGWAGEPLEMLFEFDRVRNFSAVHIHINNMFTKDVQVFSHARVYFSIGGNLFNGEPVRFSYMPDLALEHARNVTIKLHHRFGRFLKIQLYFASVWLLISEISFDSVVVTGNYTELEEDVRLSPDPGNPEYPLQRDEVKVGSNKSNRSSEKIPVKNIENEEPSHYIGFVIGLLTVVIMVLVAAIVFIVFRNQRLKTSPGHSVIPHTSNEAEKEIKFRSNESDKASLYHQNCSNVLYNQRSYPNSPDYTEVPDLVCAEYALPGYRTSNRLSNKSADSPPPLLNFLPKPPQIPPPEDFYPGSEISTLPLMTPPLSPRKVAYSKSDRHFLLPLSPEPEDLEEDTEVPVFPRERLRIIEKLGEGHFEDVHLCELSCEENANKLVVVYTLRLESFKPNFRKDVLGLVKIKHENISQLLGACLSNEPVCAVREYSEKGDLCQFLQDHVAETATPIVNTASTLSYGCLIYMATQISAGMKYLESLRYVHKDLATRNCLVGNRYNVKISDVGCYRQIYTQDYYQVDNFRRLPIRWMAWESILLNLRFLHDAALYLAVTTPHFSLSPLPLFQNKFTAKSDVWSFAVVLWEILSFAREQPFEDLSDEKVIENVTHFYQDDGKYALPDMPIGCTKEIYDLMCECWQRNESDRPNFHEIHLFLQRKNLGYSPEIK